MRSSRVDRRTGLTASSPAEPDRQERRLPPLRRELPLAQDQRHVLRFLVLRHELPSRFSKA